MTASQINLKSDFGAVGDGVTDDTGAIQAALTAAQNSSSPGIGCGNGIYAPPGCYVIGAELELEGMGPTGFGTVGMTGEGPNSTSLKWKPGTPPVPSMIRVKPNAANRQGCNEGALWGGFTLDGSGVMSRGFWLSDQCQQTIKRIGFQGFVAGAANDACIYGDVGAVGSGCLMNTVRDCWFGRSAVNQNLGIFFSAGHGNLIDHNEFYGQAAGAVRLSGGGENTIRNNDFEEMVNDATDSIDLDCDRANILFNRFEDASTAHPNSRCIRIRSGRGSSRVTGNDFGLAEVYDYHVELNGSNSEIAFRENSYGNQGRLANIKLNGFSNTDIWTDMEINGYGGLNGHIEGYSGQYSEGRGRRFGRGFRSLAINKAYPNERPLSDLDVGGQVFSLGVVTKVKAGALLDSDFSYIKDGMMAVDSTGSRLAVRVGGVWKYAPLV